MTPRATHFGTTASGEPVHSIAIGNGILSATILTLGCILQDLRHCDISHSLTVGSPDIAAYETGMLYCGAIVGPVANRIGGASAIIDGTRHDFDANENGRTTLHGGSRGTHALVWRIQQHGPRHARLALDLPHGHQGFPGNRTITALYQISDATLSLTLSASTDAPTLMNLANHSYWRLGTDPTIRGHVLHVAADHYLPTDADLLPTGKIAPVADTRFDFRVGRRLDPGNDGPLDTNFCLSDRAGPLQNVARLTGPGGLGMRMASTLPGLQVYDGSSLHLPDITGNDGAPYRAHAGLALEAQFWPDAPNHAHFPDILLRPANRWHHVTTWTFTLESPANAA